MWGTMIPIYDQPIKPFSPTRKILSTPYLAEVHPKTGNLYVVSIDGNEIIEYNRENSESKIFYKIPYSEKGTIINQMKFDFNNNLIIAGRTVISGLSTTNAFSKEISTESSSGYTFISKINSNGTEAWFTYFYNIPQNTMALTIDKDDNIYILNKRAKTDTLSSSSFQQKGDTNTNILHQDVITKLNTKGKHIWSTFYAKDDSKINAIMAADKGLYVYGMHLSNTSGSTYFGTPGSFLEKTSSKINGTSSVFLSKFNFDGERLWSTYFGNEKTYMPYHTSYISKNQSNITVIGDDVYFMCAHNSNLSQNINNLATENAYINQPPSKTQNHTLTKFTGDGILEWTTYLNQAGVLFKSLKNDALVISTTVNNNEENIHLLTTKKAYQPKFGGMEDVYTYFLSLDGKKQTYASFYGFEGNDIGYSIPTLNGFYTIGYASKYATEKPPFATKKASLKNFTKFDTDIYVGNFLGYFSN